MMFKNRCKLFCAAAPLVALALTACGSASFTPLDKEQPQSIETPAPGETPNPQPTPPGPGPTPTPTPQPGEKIYFEEDPYTQPSEVTKEMPADIIFIVDTSGSLNEERRLIADNVAALLQPLKDQNINDYRIAVIAAHSMSKWAGTPLAAPKRAKVLYESLFDGMTDACRDDRKTKDPYEQLKCEFRENILFADEDKNGVKENEGNRDPKFTENSPFWLVDDNGVNQSYVDTSDYTTFRPMGEFGLRSLEVAVTDKLEQNQNLDGYIYKWVPDIDPTKDKSNPGGGSPGDGHFEMVYVSDQHILRPEASWNFIWMSDENDICVKEAFRSDDGLWFDLAGSQGKNGKWYNTTWDPSPNGFHWQEAYGNRDYCTSSFDPSKRITPSLLVEKVKELRKDKPFTMHAFGYFDLPGYHQPDDTPRTQESHSIGYWEAVELAGGKLVDIADKSHYGDALEDIGKSITIEPELKKDFCLTHDPIPNTLKCFVDGQKVRSDLSHDPSSCSDTSHHAKVHLPYAGGAGSKVQCTYYYFAE